MDLHGKVALVTGAANGIGRGCAVALARAGATIAIIDSDTAGIQVVAQIRRLGRECYFYTGDAFNRDDAWLVPDQVIDRFGAIDILVSNPSWNRQGDVLEYDPEVFAATIHCTLTSGFFIAQRVANYMVRAGQGGSIIFISSVHSIMPFSRSPAYNAAKRGLEALAETMAADFARDNIRVNTIRPGWIDTPGERAKYGAEMDSAGTTIPLGRLGTPKDIGEAAVALASMPYITGHHLTVDGGLSLRHVIEPRRDPDQRDNTNSPIPKYK